VVDGLVVSPSAEASSCSVPPAAAGSSQICGTAGRTPAHPGPSSPSPAPQRTTMTMRSRRRRRRRRGRRRMDTAHVAFLKCTFLVPSVPVIECHLFVCKFTDSDLKRF